MIEIKFHEKYLNEEPDHSTGSETNIDFDIVLNKYYSTWVKRGYSVTHGGQYYTVQLVNMTVHQFDYFIELDNIQIKYYNPYVRVATVDKDNYIPAGLPNRTYIDNTDPLNPVTVIRTWETWRDANHPWPAAIGSYHYFVSATFGSTLTEAELKIIQDSTDAVLFDIPLQV